MADGSSRVSKDHKKHDQSRNRKKLEDIKANESPTAPSTPSALLDISSTRDRLIPGQVGPKPKFSCNYYE